MKKMNYKLFVGFLYSLGMPLYAIDAKCNEKFKLAEIVQIKLEQETAFQCDQHQKSQRLKFLSYNIQLSGLDNGNHLWRYRKYAVIQLLSYADVFTLQEVSHTQFEDLKKLLTDYELVGFNTVTGNDLEKIADALQEGLVIGFRKNIFTLKSNNMYWYSDCRDVPSQHWGNWMSAFPKALQKATLIFGEEDKEIDIFNSHFAHDEDPSGLINPRFLSSKMELNLLEKNQCRYWISAGDRNFHHPRDLQAYSLYENSPHVCDSRKSYGIQTWGTETTFLGYEDHPRVNPITPLGDFEKVYYLDVIFHNPYMMKSTLWVSHIGEYDSNLCLLPAGACKQLTHRLFASDHTAIFVLFELENFY